MTVLESFFRYEVHRVKLMLLLSCGRGRLKTSRQCRVASQLITPVSGGLTPRNNLRRNEWSRRALVIVAISWWLLA